VGIFAEDAQGRFVLMPLPELLLTELPGSLRPLVTFMAESAQWQSWSELRYTVTTGEPAFRRVHGMGTWEYRAGKPEFRALFSQSGFRLTKIVPTQAALSIIEAALE
jgi:hypothetical protein